MYDYSQFRIGDNVEADTDPNMTSPSLGQIINVGDGAIDILITQENGVYPLHSCWHVDDERAQDPGRFREAQELWTDDETNAVQMGVFRLTRNQELLIGLEAKLRAIESSIEGLVVRVSEVESKVRNAVQPPPKRKPGRPPKNPEPLPLPEMSSVE